MTQERESLRHALEDHDITLTLTPGQLIVLAVGLFLFLRFLRGLRG